MKRSEQTPLVQVFGPGDKVPDKGMELLRTTAPAGHDLLVTLELEPDLVLAMATFSPERALAVAHAAAEVVEGRGKRARVVFAPDVQRLVAAAARDIAQQEECGRHRRLVDAIRPRWDRLVAALTPSTRH